MSSPQPRRNFFSRRYPYWLQPRLKWGMSFFHIRPQTVAKGISVPPAPPVFQFSPQRRERLRERYLRRAASDLSFAPDVVAQRGLDSVPYLRCGFKHLYRAHPISVVQPTRARTGRRRCCPGLEAPEHPAVDLEAASARDRVQEVWTQRVARQKQQQQTLPRRLEIVLPPRQPDTSPSFCAIVRKQDFEDVSPGQRESWVAPPEKEARAWENMVLKKLNKRTARWIVGKRPQKPGVSPGKWQSFLRDQYDWSHIRDELSSDSQLELLEQLEREEMTEVESSPTTPSDLEEEPEMMLSMYYRLPKYLPQEQKDETVTCQNKTTDEINQEKGPLRFSDQSNFLRLTPRAGKFSYATDNAFEQEIYLEKVKIVHPIGTKRSQIVLENRSRYEKQLCKIFPQTPEKWTSQPVPAAPHKPVKGARRWTALPIRVKELLQSREADTFIKPRELHTVYQLLKRHKHWKLEALQKILQEWKTDWGLIIEWRQETIEGLRRKLVNLHSDVRIHAITTCAMAALERPRTDSIQECLDMKETKASHLQDLPEVLYPALEATLSDENVNVRMAAALCQYALRSHNPLAQDIMEAALLNGNSVDSWAAAQCLALEGSATYPVIKRILHQLFNKRNKDTEKHSSLLLRHLNNQTVCVCDRVRK